MCYQKFLFEKFAGKQSIISPFLNFDFPDGNLPHELALTKDLILNDSWPLRTSTSCKPLLFIYNLHLINLVKSFFLIKLFFKIAFNGFSSFVCKELHKYG